MKKFGTITVYQGDVREVLPTLADESVHCVVTSPPYWGLRDYGTATWEGGAAECDHRMNGERRQLPHGDGRVNDCYVNERVLIPCVGASFKERCGKCGAIRIDSQLGLERTPEEYIANMVGVFREVKRVLRADGTAWVNMGDSYNGQGARSPNIQQNGSLSYRSGGNAINVAGLKPKDLCGIPWMLAFALRADGWYLRQDIIWAKPNPMPESVTDRCTKSHEYIFLLSKSERYYCDMEAIKEPLAQSSINRLSQNVVEQIGGARVPGKTNGNMKAVRFGGAKYGDDGREESRTKSGNEWNPDESSRNKRSVWNVPTQSLSEEHFATFPEDLIRPCILAGCPAGGTVLDPFFGSGTTGLVARDNGCKAIGIELNPDYIQIAARRLSQEVLNFSEVPV